MQIKFHLRAEKALASLDKRTLARVLRTLDLLEKFGSRLTMPHSKKIAEGLFELRVQGKQRVRIFYTFYLGEIVVLHLFVKKTQKNS